MLRLQDRRVAAESQRPPRGVWGWGKPQEMAQTWVLGKQCQGAGFESPSCQGEADGPWASPGALNTSRSPGE